jgi:hypothetical protein
LLAGDAAATDPVCRLSPHHNVVLDAVAAAERENAPFVYRNRQNSERLSVSMNEAVIQHPSTSAEPVLNLPKG